MAHMLAAASLEEARHMAADNVPDLCVVDPRRLAGSGRTARIPANPFDPVRTPGILLAEDTSRDMIRAASAAGYKVVLALPVTPRLLYRRIGAMLQRARRTARRRNSKAGASALPAPADLLEP